jgi:hypothetical protein
VQAVGPPTIGEISGLKPAYFSIYLHILLVGCAFVKAAKPSEAKNARKSGLFFFNIRNKEL